MVRKKAGNRYRTSRHPRKAGFSILSVLKWTTAFAGVAVFFAGLAYSFLYVYDLAVETPCFAAKTVDVQGNARVSGEEILKLAGIREGMNVLSLNLPAARERILDNPWISGAGVRRQLPDKIFIQVTEHEPVAVLDLDRKFLLDTRGELFKIAEPGDLSGLPLVRGLEFSDISVAGEPMSPPFKALVEFLRARRESDKVLPAAAVSEVRVDRDMGITVVAGNPAVSVRLGFDKYSEKLARLDYVLTMDVAEGAALRAVDLLDLDRVVVQPVKKEPPPKGKKKKPRRSVA